MHNPFRRLRSDPYWDLDGRAARDARRQQRIVGSIVIMLSAVILALIVARLPAVDATALLSGPSRPVVLTSLAIDVMACCLIVARDSRRGRALRQYGELPVIRA